MNKKIWENIGTDTSKLKTAEECIQAAGLDWDVKTEPLARFKTKAKLPSNFGNFRQDNGFCLGVVKKRYSVIQNRELFSFFDAAVDKGAAIYEKTGSLFGGKIVFIMCKLNKNMLINGDKYETYALLHTSHDGTKPLSALLTSVRMVCTNQLSVIMKDAANMMKIRHCKHYTTRLEEAEKVLKLSSEHFVYVAKELTNLQNKKMNDSEANKFLEVFVKGESGTSENMREDLRGLFKNGKGNEGRTRYDMLNAVTEFYTHNRQVRIHGDKDVNEVIFDSVLMGTASKKASKAMEILLS